MGKVNAGAAAAGTAVGHAPGREDPVVAAGRVAYQRVELPRGLVAVAAPLPGAPEPVGRRLAQAPHAARGLKTRPARGALGEIAAEPRHPAEPPERGGGLVLVRVVGGEAHVGLLRVRAAVGRLQQLRLQEQRVRGDGTLRVLPHQPIEGDQRGVAIATLAQAAQLQEPRGPALGRREGERVAGRRERGLVASEPARRVHHDPEGALAHVGRGLLRHQGLRLGERPLDQAPGEQALGADRALGGTRRGHRDAPVGQRLQLRLRRVAVGGGRLQPERGEGPGRRGLISGGQLRLAQEIARAGDVQAIGMAAEHPLEEAHRRARIARRALHRGGPDQGGGAEPALRGAIGRLGREAAGLRGLALAQQAVGAVEQRVVLERRPDPGRVAELACRRAPVPGPVRRHRDREALPHVGGSPAGAAPSKTTDTRQTAAAKPFAVRPFMGVSVPSGPVGPRTLRPGRDAG